MAEEEIEDAEDPEGAEDAGGGSGATGDDALPPPAVRIVLALGVAVAVAWLGGLILGEYPFTGVLPVVGGFLLGVTVAGSQAFVYRDDPPVWVIAVGAALAVWGIWRAAWLDAGGIGPLPDLAWVSMAAAGVGALTRLIPSRSERRSRQDPA